MLYYAAVCNLPEFADEMLKDDRVSVNFSERTEPALLKAAMMGNTEVVARLLRAPDIRVNQASVFLEGMTPLYVAIQGGHAKIVKILLANKNLNAGVLYGGESYLHHAVRAGNAEIFKVLMDDGRFDLGAANARGETALDLALQQQCENSAITELLLRNKSNHIANGTKFGAHLAVGEVLRGLIWY